MVGVHKTASPLGAHLFPGNPKGNIHLHLGLSISGSGTFWLQNDHFRTAAHKWVPAAPKTRSFDKSDRPAAHTIEPCVPPAYQTNNCASARPLNVPSQVDQRGAAPRGAQQPRCLRRLRARPVVLRCSAVIVGLSRGRRCTGGSCAR